MTTNSQDAAGERRERGTAIWFIGLAFLVADMLVIFFAPAALRIGRHNAFFAIIVALLIVGAGLMLWGRLQQRRAR